MYETHMDEVVSVLSRYAPAHINLLSLSSKTELPIIWLISLLATCSAAHRVYSRLVDCEYLYDLLVKQLPQTHTRQVLANRLTLQTFRCNTINMTGTRLGDLMKLS